MQITGTIFLYFIGINVIAFILMAIDKHKAKKKAFRISERTFWVLGFFGGALGVFLAMRQYRHKTKHRSFIIGIPMLIFLQAAFFFYVVIMS
ncbi:DUF1294 domain-containing protein [Lentibacillus cibarius]|uniref:DUF1294 domain-containing protein n=1 Tax=Lentibacillus cibarius TaxID=2583219 RepID=A0A549YM02_9BACI|nr:DUF1294 domain-containing protein [Lentibacillus cibarius]TMN21129.1 DUF1294 domain-containing protein [Lentibacillus cibarius]TRM12909.1 DUF1294 domain-containing protein [Lentibacillus cibarius]